MCWKWPPFPSDRIEPGAPYFGKSLPVRPLSLPEFLQWYLLSRRLCFMVCFGKLSLSDIPIRNNQAALRRIGRARWPKSLRNDAFAEKGLNFGHAGVWSVGCPSILLEVSNWEFHIVQLIYKGLEDFHICSCCDGCIEEDGTNYAPPGHPTPNTNLLWMRGFTTDTFLFISHTTNVLLFKFRCNIFIGVTLIKEMPGLLASETLCSI